MKTFTPRPQDVERRWYVVDADGAVLGRLASEVAKILRGKHKPIFAPHADTGDHVVVVNAEGIRLTGGKEEKKIDYRHSGYPGGLRETPYSRLLSERPVYVVEKAVRGMLPKNRLGRAMVRKLQVYPGPEHPHAAQKPIPLALGQVPAWEGLPAPAPKKEKPEAKRPATRPKGRARSTAPATKRTTAKRTGAKATTAKRTAAKRPAARATMAGRTGSAKAATAKASEVAKAAETGKPKRRVRRTKKDEEG